MMRFREYVEKRESMDWLPEIIKSVPIWGWAASALATSAYAALKHWLQKRALTRKEDMYMSDWWRTLDHWIEKTGPDSEQVKRHMEMTQYPPLDAVKDMAKTHLESARKMQGDLRKYDPSSRVPA